MTEEDKDLLLKDICTRLPYRVRCNYYDCCEGDYDNGTICGFERREYIQIDGVCIHIEEVKPYLLPLSSMTEEQWDNAPRVNLTNFTFESFKCGCFTLSSYTCENNLHDLLEVINWLYANHFDVNGLIPLGLANDATGLNIY